MKKYVLFFLFFVSTLLSLSQTQWKVYKSSVIFKIKNGGLTVDGSFGPIIADIKFDDINYAKGSMEGTINANTINTGIEMRNKHLKSEDYFDVTKFPTIKLRSTLFSKEKDGTYKGYFKLTMKDVTKDVVLPFSYSVSGNGAVFRSTFVLNRTDYGVGGSSWTMADNVSVTIIVDAVK